MNEFYSRLRQLLLGGESVVMATAVEPSGDDAFHVQRAFQCGDELVMQEKALAGFWTDTFAKRLPRQFPGTVSNGHKAVILFERVCSRQRLVICGGGHIAQPLAQIAGLLDFDVTVIDDREEFANRGRFPTAQEVLCQPFDRAMAGLAYTDSSYFVIITRGHEDDRFCLGQVLDNRFGYVGMIGSRKKVAVVMEQMERDGYPKELLGRVHAPIGLRIGAQTPAEIAVCIAAELVQARSGAEDGSIPPQALALLAQGQPMAMATILSKEGSAPRSVGAKLLVDEAGALYGTIGGGSGEAAAIEQARRTLREQLPPRLIVCDMTNEDARKSGMVCGGKLTVLVEPTAQETFTKC